MAESNRDGGGGFINVRSLGLLWFMACTVAGVCLITKGRLAAEASPSSTAVRAASYDTPTASNVYRPIEQIHVGQRVVTPGTEAGVLLGTVVDPATWRLLHLRMTDRWPDGTQDVTDIRTVQGPQWVGQVRAAVGARVAIPLDLAEMGEPAGATAEVVSIDACPTIEAGPGRLVLTTVSHLNAFLFDLAVRGERGPASSVTVTGWHKLYSEDRQAWASVCELRVGETLRGRDGPLTVASLARHPGVETVYNMTVEGEHQYYVADANLLAHNDNCYPNDFATKNTKNWSGAVNSEGEARAFARNKLGSNPVEVEPGKWRSQDGRWQYRAKPGDVADNHLHLEQLNPQTGEVIQNCHLRWPEGTER